MGNLGDIVYISDPTVKNINTTPNYSLKNGRLPECLTATSNYHHEFQQQEANLLLDLSLLSANSGVDAIDASLLDGYNTNPRKSNQININLVNFLIY